MNDDDLQYLDPHEDRPPAPHKRRENAQGWGPGGRLPPRSDDWDKEMRRRHEEAIESGIRHREDLRRNLTRAKWRLRKSERDKQ